MSDVSVADPRDAAMGPMERLEQVKADQSAPSVIFQRLTDGETLPQVAKSWSVPKGEFVKWFTTEHMQLYDTALKVRAADLALEALEISDGVPVQAVGPDGKGLFDEAGKPVLVEPSVARDKLRAATRQWHAARFDRARFGEHSGVKVEVEDKRAPVDRTAMVLETSRAMAYFLAEAMRVKPQEQVFLPAPIEAEPVVAEKKVEKIEGNNSASEGAGLI